MADQNNMLPADDSCLGSAVAEIRERLFELTDVLMQVS